MEAPPFLFRTDPVLDPLSILEPRLVATLKTGIAEAGVVLLVWGARLDMRGQSQRFRRTRDVLLAILGVAAFAAYFNFGRFHHPTFVQHSDFFQYYTGAKFFPELGYTRLYACATVADLEDGLQASVERRWLRDLTTNEATYGARAVPEPDLCKRHFTPARWKSFQEDVRWFRTRMTRASWDAAMMSHGYNGTPVGTSIGYTLANLSSASDRQVLALALLDPVLIVAMWALVAWAFGWRTMAVGLLWWGTNLPARWSWVGGSFLRALYLVAFVGAICAARRGLFTSAGSALGVASMLRIFPAVAAGGPVLALIARWWTARGLVLPVGSRRLGLGFLASVVLLGMISLLVPSGRGLRGSESWHDFLQDTVVFSQTPLTNTIGLRTAISFEERSRAVHLQRLWDKYPWDTWKAARLRVFAQRKWIYAAIVAAFVILLLRAVANREEWVTLTLGSGLIPFVTDLPGYYYSFLLVFAFLWPRFPWIGVSLLALSALSNVTPSMFDGRDDRSMFTSIAVLLFVTLATTLVAISHRGHTPTVRPNPQVRSQ